MAKANANILIILLVCAAAQAQPQLPAVDCWLYQLQNLNLESMAATNFDLVVMDYSQDGGASGEFTAGQIAALQASNKIVLAYLSIGEAENYRYYWQPSWAPGNPPWLGPENPDWPGNYKVRYWMQGWRDILFGTAAGPDRSYLDRILQQGFDGIYLDVIDAYYFWGPEGEMPENSNSASDMVGLVADLADYARVTYGQADFYIFPQNGESLWDDAPSQQAQIYLNTLNGMGAEDVFYFGNQEENNPYYPQQYEIGLLDGLITQGKTVLSVEYLTLPALIDQYYPLAQSHAYIPYATVRALDELRINPGHEPPENPVAPIRPQVVERIHAEIHPNPGNQSVRISYWFEKPGWAQVSIYSLNGRLAELFPLEFHAAQEVNYQWTCDGAGGIYLVNLTVNGANQVQKLLIVK